MPRSPRPARPHWRGRKRALVRRGSYVPVHVMREERVVISDAEHERNRPEERPEQVATPRQWRDRARRAPARPLRRSRAPRRHRSARRHVGRVKGRDGPDPDPEPSGARWCPPASDPFLERAADLVPDRRQRREPHAPAGVRRAWAERLPVEQRHSGAA